MSWWLRARWQYRYSDIITADATCLCQELAYPTIPTAEPLKTFQMESVIFTEQINLASFP